jgi:hypothetical protein
MTLSGVEWVRAPSKVEGLALAATSRQDFFLFGAKLVLRLGLHGSRRARQDLQAAGRA